MMEKEHFDFVVLQQGPSSLLESRANLRAWAASFAEIIRRRGGVPALYMVWPEETRLRMMGAVAESYRLAAKDVKGLILAGGEAWSAAWRIDPSIHLYGPDRFHPSELGSLLAALIIYEGLSGDAPVSLPNRLSTNALAGTQIVISAKDSLTLLGAARQVIRMPYKPIAPK
jgi:hypothetical protein